MKRINQETGLPYKSGDKPTPDDLPLRAGKVFYGYATERIKKDGFFVERWLRVESLVSSRKASRMTYLKRKGRVGRKELNPTTGSLWVSGDYCPSRGYFLQYQTAVKNSGYHATVFAKNRTEYDEKRIRKVLSVKRAKCRRAGILWDLSFEHVQRIFPAPLICPVFKKPMEWADSPGHADSPSLDRIIPERGYIEGNVAWISNKANRLKGDASLSEITSLCNWLEQLDKKIKS